MNQPLFGLLLGNNSLTHRSDFLCGNEVILKVLTYKERSLDIGKINIPLANNVYLDITIVKYSAPEGTVYVTGENLGEHALLLGLVEHASLLDNKAVIELNISGSEQDNVYKERGERNQSQHTENNRKQRNIRSKVGRKTGHNIFTKKCTDNR